MNALFIEECLFYCTQCAKIKKFRGLNTALTCLFHSHTILQNESESYGGSVMMSLPEVLFQTDWLQRKVLGDAGCQTDLEVRSQTWTP